MSALSAHHREVLAYVAAIGGTGGRSAAALDRRVAQRCGRVEHYPRLDLHVWHLVGRALKAMGYWE